MNIGHFFLSLVVTLFFVCCILLILSIFVCTAKVFGIPSAIVISVLALFFYSYIKVEDWGWL